MGKTWVCLCLVVGFEAFASDARINCFPTDGLARFAESPIEQVSAEERDRVFQGLTALYASEIETRHQVLKVYEEDTTEFGAFAFPSNSENAEGAIVANVQIYKGVRFNSHMTLDGYTVITCHEIGHHLGGLPLAGWASLEGEADYFATLKCMRRYLTSLPRNELYASQPSLAMVARCQSEFSSPDEVQACARSLEATQALGLVLKDVTHDPVGEGQVASVDKVDPNIVAATDTSHPHAQCRVDTYRAGALCPISMNEDISYTDYKGGVCNLQVVPEQSRPACWFADPEKATVLSSN